MTASEYSSLIRTSPEKAHRALFDEYFGYAYTIVHNRLRDAASPEDIEECVSDVFADVFLKYEGGDFSGDMKGYIGTLAKRRAVDRYRQIKRRAVSVSLDDETAGRLRADTDIAADSEKRELSRLLLEKVLSLGEPDSTMIMQKFYFNKNSRQIGTMIGMKASAVRMRCSRAEKKLKAMLAAEGLLEE
ncbi:MAG: sigma-70 family RNA polymerase sigma factor [Ruminococcus sp.]|nr:sigma-70 family RNA polymerase sigma factor [Ruminococcus sp.]